MDNWRFGSAAQIGRTSFSVSDLSSSGTSTNYGVSLYGSSEFSNATWAFGGAYSRHSISTSRTLAFGGLSESLSGRYDASTFQVFSKFSYDFAFDTAILTPFAEVDHVMHKTNSFTETGGAAAITSGGDTSRTTFVTLGMDAVHKFSRTAKLPAIVHGTIGWRHAFDNKINSANSFANGQQFAVSGTNISSNAVIVNAGVDFSLSATVDVGFNYSGQFGTSGNQVHAAKALISAKF